MRRLLVPLAGPTRGVLSCMLGIRRLGPCICLKYSLTMQVPGACSSHLALDRKAEEIGAVVTSAAMLLVSGRLMETIAAA